MYGDTGTTAHDGFGAARLRRSMPDSAFPWSHREKVLAWIGLAGTGWVAVILAGYFAWSAF